MVIIEPPKSDVLIHLMLYVIRHTQRTFKV
jgi:hypothetical protein